MRKNIITVLLIIFWATAAFGWSPVDKRTGQSQLPAAARASAMSGPMVSLPIVIDDPTWTKPGVQKDTILRLENIGDEPIIFSYVTAIRITGTTYDWLGLANVPMTISHLYPNYANMTVQLNKGGAYFSHTPVAFDGLIVLEGNFLSSPDTIGVHLIIADTVQFPQTVAIRTAKKRLAINNVGKMGNSGALDSSMNFFDDCDTMDNLYGADDNAKTFLFEASPFLMRIIGSDTVIFSSIYNNDWLHNDGFRPQKGIIVDSSNTSYQYSYTGPYLSRDSQIGVESWYWAPLAADSSDFIIQRIMITNKTAVDIPNLYVGQFMDWDIPSDSGVENGSDYDASRNLIYMFGAEYGPDTGLYAEGLNGNDCILADQRAGGFAFYKGFKFPASSSADTFTTLVGALTLDYFNWVASRGNFVPGQLWKKLEGFSGYECWQSDHPEMEDSLYRDLVMVSVYGKYNLYSGGSLGFVKILATGNSGIADFKTAIDKARQWIANHAAVVQNFSCCDLPGDVNNDGKVNLKDVSYYIYWKYYWAPPPPCLAEADTNIDGKINLSDVSYLINYLYRHGPKMRCL